MKISQSKVRVEPNKAISTTNSNVKSQTTQKTGAPKQASVNSAAAPKALNLVKKVLKPAHPPAIPAADGFMSYSETAVAFKQVLAKAKAELKLIQKMKEDTARYQQKVATQARSEAQQLILNARVTTHREIEAIIRQASKEIQQVLADIRITRITAQEELATQRRYIDAAKINSLSLSIKDTFTKPAESGKEKKPETVKP
jgi:vacuolar-type H+-ATPase subunit H